MAKAARIKARAADFAVPQTAAEVTEAIAAIGRAARERARIEAEMGDALAALRERFEAQALSHAQAIRELTDGVQTWCEANREALTAGKSKTASFASGDVAWRMTPPKVVLKGVEAVLAALKRRNLLQFVRVKEEVSKEAILNDYATVRTIPGISIDQHEEFIVTPHEAALQEVAP